MAYTEPTSADLKMRYPAFVAVDDATVAYWLTDSARYVDTSWMEGDYGPAKIAHAAYEMAKAGVSGFAGGDVAGIAASGVTDFKSGTFQARFSDEAVKVAVAGGYASNRYGQDYLDLLSRNKSGPRVTAPGHISCGGYFGDRPWGYPC